KRHPTRHDLDRASTDHPIWITHVSGHLGAGNTAALARAKITRETPQPKSGRFHTDADGDPNGVFEECTSLVTRVIPARTQEQDLRAIEAAVEQYARQGVTTAVIASGSPGSIADLLAAVKLGLLKFRIITMTSGGPALESRKKIEALDSPYLKAGAIKLLQDGSIQGYTGYLSRAYFVAPTDDMAYRGYAMRSRDALAQRVTELHRAGYQLAIHGNGDQAIDDILHAYAVAQRAAPSDDARHRIEHCQTVRDD